MLFLGSTDGELLAPERPECEAQHQPLRPQPTTPLRLGIRSIVGWPVEADMELALEKYFDKRSILDPSWWQSKIFPELEAFLARYTAERRPLLLDFAAHSSIAFAAGYCLEAKSGLDITVRQRFQGGKTEWKAIGAPLPEVPLWWDKPEKPGTAGAADMALAISATHRVVDDVDLYIEEAGLQVSRIVPVELYPETGQMAVKGGTHALQLAQSVSHKIRSRTVQERRGILHLFAAAPNAFLFFLGQLSRGFGRVQLYEYDFETNVPGAYTPSIQLPPPKT